MTALPDALRAAIADGASALTLWPSGREWQAALRNRHGGWQIGIDADPVAAIEKALGATTAPDEPDWSVLE